MFTRLLWSQLRYIVNGLKCALFSAHCCHTKQVLTGDVPFINEKTNWTVVPAVLSGDRPSRPEHSSCTGNLWVLITRCWDQDPRLRPEMREVSQIFSSVP